MSEVMYLKIIFVVCGVFYSVAAISGQVTQGDLQVTKVMTGYSSGEAFFFVNKEPANPSGCSNTASSSFILAVDPDKSDVEQVLSVLLTAFVSGRHFEVQVYDNTCFSGHAVIRRVAIY